MPAVTTVSYTHLDVYKRQDQLRARVFDPTEFPDTESYIWFLRNNVVRTTGLDFPLPEGDVEQQARMMFSQLAKVGALTILED